jgi:hypothetical protein
MCVIKAETCCSKWRLTINVWVVNDGLGVILFNCMNLQGLYKPKFKNNNFLYKFNCII